MCSKHSCFAYVFFNTSRPLGSGCFSIQLSYFLFFLVKVHRNILVTYFPPSQKSTFHTQSDRNARNFIYFDAKHGSSRIKLSFLKLKILDIFRQLFFFLFFFCEKWQVLLQHIPSLQDTTCSSFPPVYCCWKTNAKFPPFCMLWRFPAAPLARWQPSPNTSPRFTVMEKEKWWQSSGNALHT